MIDPVDPVQERRPPISPQLAWRVALLGGIALALFAIVFFRLWYLQVLSGDQYLAEANNNRVRDERIQAPRGDIVDRNGDVIVTNRRAIVVDLSPADLPDVERSAAARWGQLAGQREARPKGSKGPPIKIPDIPTAALRHRFRRLARVLGDTTATKIQRQVIQSLAQVPYAPVRVETDVPRSVLNYIQERQELFGGVDVEQVYLRQYPRKTLAAQMLGTVGEVSPLQLGERHFKGVKQGTIVGQEGLEYEYDRYLRGTDGSRRIQVDALGNPKGDLREVAPKAGERLKLTLDMGLQRAGQDALTGQANPSGHPAAFVAINPRNGEILGMGSYPSFDPNVLSGRPLTQKQYDALFGPQAGSPRYNRAIGGLYPTGSTFKPITALAGLESGTISASQIVQDSGCVKIGEMDRCNTGKTPNGAVDMISALKVSSDVYFYLLGQSLDPLKGQVLQTWAKRLGLGRDTGIDLPSEQAGLIPDRKWRAYVAEKERKCRKRNNGQPCGISDMRPWTTGDNVNLAIGQGDLQATPLQMAVAYSTLANGGRVPTPHVGLEVENAEGELIQRIERDPARHVKIDPAARATIMTGLRDAAMSPGGTSYDVFKDWPRDLPVYGKTGTAERPPKPDQSWYVAYVPAGRGRSPIVVAVTVESCGCFGAEAAAPIARLILSEHFGIKPKFVKGTSATR
jgi:penicillin-binding protein 2